MGVFKFMLGFEKACHFYEAIFTLQGFGDSISTHVDAL